jgi:hypothetical protein
MTKKHEKMLWLVRLELARDHDYPNGSKERGYDFIAPLDGKGHIDLDAWKDLRARCRVKRFWAHEADAVGHVVHKRGNVWAFHYDMHGDRAHDEAGFRFDTHAFIPGEYVSINEQDGQLRTFRVASVRELED